MEGKGGEGKEKLEVGSGRDGGGEGKGCAIPLSFRY